MISSHSFLWLTLLLLLTISCSSESTPEMTGYCSNALALISAPDSLTVVELDYNQPEDSMISLLEQKLEQELCEETYFGIPLQLPIQHALAKSVAIKVRTNKRCSTDPVYMRLRYMFPIFLLNAERLLIDHEVGRMDSIRSQIHDFYFDGYFDGMDGAQAAFLRLKWNQIVRKETIEQVLAAIIEGYLDAAETFAQRRFKSDLCSLTSEQLLSVQKDFPFALEFQLAPLPIPLQLPDVEVDTVEDFL